MIRKQRNLLDAKMKNVLVKCFRDKKVGTVLFLYSKILSCKNDTDNDNLNKYNLTQFSPNNVDDCNYF
jgi:hypothetical protein